MEQNTNTGVPMTPTVDNRQKSGNGLKIATAIACIAAVCGIGFGVYGMMQSSEKDNQISDLKIQIKDLGESVNIKPSETIEPSESTTTADIYENFANNLSKNNSVTVFGYYYHWTGSDNIKRTVASRIENSHLTVTDIDNGDTVIAEADGIISAYYVEIGNGGVPYMYLIKKDGSVARIDISENGTRTIEDLDGYEKIVSIFSGSDLYAHLIDINGNVYKNS